MARGGPSRAGGVCTASGVRYNAPPRPPMFLQQAEELPEFDRLWNFRDPAETERRFREILPRAECAGTAAYLGELRTQIARTLGLQRRFDEAHSLLDGVEEALPSVASPRLRVRYLLERGRTLNSSKRPSEARPLFLEAWELGRKCGEHALAVDAAHMMAIVEPPEEQLAWNLRAMEFAEKSHDERAKRWLGTLYNNIGWTHFEAKEYERSLEVHRKGLAWQEAHGTPRTLQIARWSVGRLLRALGRIDEALPVQQALLAEVADPDAFVHEELGECLLAKGRADEARAHFAKAHPLLAKEQWIADSDPERLARVARLAGFDQRPS